MVSPKQMALEIVGPRLGRLDWRRIGDDGVRERYADLHDQLETHARTARERASALNLTYYFMLEYNAGVDGLPHPADLATLNHFADGEERARQAWQALVGRQQWKRSALRDARSKLSKVLLVVDGGPLARVINPAMRRSQNTQVLFENRRAQVHTFSLHDCLPFARTYC